MEATSSARENALDLQELMQQHHLEPGFVRIVIALNLAVHTTQRHPGQANFVPACLEQDVVEAAVDVARQTILIVHQNNLRLQITEWVITGEMSLP